MNGDVLFAIFNIFIILIVIFVILLLIKKSKSKDEQLNRIEKKLDRLTNNKM